MYALSVILANYNENRDFLKLCIDSVLNQTYKDFEFIIVVEPDEANLNFLNKVAIADRRIKILKNAERLGVAGSRNRAIMGSAGRYIAFIDGDDYCDLSRLDKQLKFLESNPEISVVGSNMYLIDENNNIRGERKYPELFEDIKKGFLMTMAIANPTIMMRRKDLQDIGLFDSHFYKAEDFELWLRFLANNKKMYNLQENLVYYRIPASHNDRRGRIHWKNNYIARKRHSKFIWPLRQRLLSEILYFIISYAPGVFLESLLNFKIVNNIKKIRMN